MRSVDACHRDPLRPLGCAARKWKELSEVKELWDAPARNHVILYE